MRVKDIINNVMHDITKPNKIIIQNIDEKTKAISAYTYDFKEKNVLVDKFGNKDIKSLEYKKKDKELSIIVLCGNNLY